MSQQSVEPDVRILEQSIFFIVSAQDLQDFPFRDTQDTLRLICVYNPHRLTPNSWIQETVLTR